MDERQEGLWFRSGGREDGPLLLLLHGLGATCDVFAGVIAIAEHEWPGPWLAPDLHGHGRSRHATAYSFEEHAADVALLVGDAERDVFVLGHSLGGVVGLTMAAGARGGRVKGVVGLGIKVVWTDEDLSRAAALTQRPPAVFATKLEAAERFLKIAGLTGLRHPDHPIVEGGIRHDGSGWHLAMDPKAFGLGAPDMSALLTAGECPVVLARGATDSMVTLEQLQALRAEAHELDGIGHNAHVEDPAAAFHLVKALSQRQHAR